jgi:RHS repeat-associated protein
MPAREPIEVNFNHYEIVPYGGNQDFDPIMTIEEDGQTLHLVGNAWKKISLPYSVTENTLLTLDFKSTARGEVHGIGLDDDDTQNAERTFRLYGTQIWGELTYDSYATSAPEWKHYTIAVGQFYTGEMGFLFFVNDHDVADPNADSFFRNVQIYETDGAIPTPEPTATTTGNYEPVGWLDAVNEEYFSGWAKDDDVAGPIWVQIYVDGAFIHTELADDYREDIGAHAFHWVHPDWGPGTHEVRVYAMGVDPGGNPDGQDIELNGSPKSYDVPDATATPTATAIEPTPTPAESLPPSPHDANFYYDGDGNRVLSILDGVATVYLGDYYEYDVGTGITRSYYGSGSAMRVAGASDPESNGVFYLLKDHLGSTNLAIDSAGNLVGEMRYKAWGETRYISGTTPTDFNYTGQRQEQDLGFYYYKARWYDPALGRFMQADTIVPEPGNPMALDRYAYTRNNPTANIDPSGQCDIGFSLTYVIPLYGQVMLVKSCIEDVEKAIDAYEAGERRPLVLYAHGTGITDALVSTAEEIDQLNRDVDTVFSNAAIEERLPAAVNLGWTSVSTAANIIGVAQGIRGIKAFSRSGSGGSAYYVDGTRKIANFGSGDELFRVYGGDSPLEGAWAFLKNPGNRISAIQGGALPPGNLADSYTRITFNGLIEAEVSTVAPLFGQPGGFTQVRMPRSADIIFSPGKYLPYGFMPLVPRELSKIITSIFGIGE